MCRGWELFDLFLFFSSNNYTVLQLALISWEGEKKGVAKQKPVIKSSFFFLCHFTLMLKTLDHIMQGQHRYAPSACGTNLSHPPTSTFVSFPPRPCHSTGMKYFLLNQHRCPHRLPSLATLAGASIRCCQRLEFIQSQQPSTPAFLRLPQLWHSLRRRPPPLPPLITSYLSFPAPDP